MGLIVVRKPAYTLRKLVMPMFMLILLSAVGHMLPVESGERIGFSMTAILTMTITNQYIIDAVPRTEEEPSIVYYGRFSMISMMLSLITTIVIINIYHKTRNPMPPKISRILHVICRLLLITGSNEVRSINVTTENKASDNEDWVKLAHALDRLSLVFLISLCAVPMIIVSSSLTVA